MNEMTGRVTPRELLLCLLALVVLACGGDSPTAPAPAEATSKPELRASTLPPQIYGAFAPSADVPEIAANGGNVVLVVPTYADDATTVAIALQANGKLAIISAHHVFGGPREAWGLGASTQALSGPRFYSLRGALSTSPGGWERTREWMAPLERRGLVVGVYVVDEPLHNGIPAARRDEAIAIVRAAGYRTVVGEWVDEAVRNQRAPSDLYGATCYAWPGEGSWSAERCHEAYRTHPEWNLAIGQAFDMYERGKGNGPIAWQIAKWAEIGRQRAGVVFWVARWPGQTGILDDPEVRAAFNAAGRQ